ncbi:MAG TPA: hypothetical protein VFC44_15750, partial [Candidatus Saccharimonadales bacterium]|nr:hypothetical protein [Candidatus Saccharimonadales bacterium]
MTSDGKTGLTTKSAKNAELKIRLFFSALFAFFAVKFFSFRLHLPLRFLRCLIVAPKLFIVCKESRRDSSPQPTVNNFAPPKRFTVNNVIFT